MYVFFLLFEKRNLTMASLKKDTNVDEHMKKAPILTYA